MSQDVPANIPLTIDALQARVARLAEDKSNLQLVMRLIERLNPLPDVADMVRDLLVSIVETVGGTNIGIYYWSEDKIHYRDFAGQDTLLDEVADPLVRQVMLSHAFLEQPGAPSQALLKDGVVPGAWTWIFPLLVGANLVGVVKLENLHISGASLRKYLPVFFSHAALILSNEIRNLARRKAEEGQRLAASVFANSQEGILISDAENHIIDVNPAFTRITGYSRAEAVGRDPGFLTAGRQEPDFYAAMWAAIKVKGAWQGEIWNRRKTGDAFPELLSINAVNDEQGRVRHYVGVFSDISTFKAHEAELDRIAHYDMLTGVPNRRLLGDRLEQAIARARRSGRILAVCYLDLDGFKPINDRFGHDAGDRLLVEITRRLQRMSRGDDTLARLGGDEFVLLWNDIQQESECYAALDRILSEVGLPMPMGGVSVAVTASVGVTLFPRDNADADSLLRHADQAMYRAKEDGKNRFHLYDPEHDRQIKARRETQRRLVEALEKREFVLYYQPKVHLVEGTVIGAEALIRWQHPERGLLPPGEFLDYLTGSDLEISVGEWVIETALTQMAVWRAMGLDLGVSVNIGPDHLQQPGFVDRLSEALARHPEVPAQRLELEILESAAIGDMDNASRILSACLALGVHFALDDFGTGYASLAYFRKLPVQTLKIDQAFVRDMLDDPEDLGIVDSVVRLAQVFNRPVIAEGVETIEHGAVLVQLGCYLGQGYGIARPMPATQLPAWIASWHGQRLWQDLAAVSVSKDSLPLLVAAASHRKWVDSVVAYVRGDGIDLAKPRTGDECRFGRWYGGSGSASYGHLPQYRTLGQLHERMHRMVSELVALVDQGGGEAARASLPVLRVLSDALAEGLGNLRNHVGDVDGH
jgi:diguanylate cyclase (GGDEF)-like protein/PAS domain S-box-containing protein